jgi:List-Bact-rpt repeat protein/IPT/TIG domain-containing protein
MTSKLLVLLAALALALPQETTAQSGLSLAGATVGDLDNPNDSLTKVPGGSAVPPRTYILDVASGSGDGIYPMGAMVKVSADPPPPGQQFAGWAGDTAILSNPFLPNTTAIIPSMNVSLSANYADPEGAALSPTSSPTPTPTPTPTPSPPAEPRISNVFPAVLHTGAPQIFVIVGENLGQRPRVTVGGVAAEVRTLLPGAAFEVTLPHVGEGTHPVVLFIRGKSLTTSVVLGEPGLSTLLHTLVAMKALVAQVVDDPATKSLFLTRLESIRSQVELQNFEIAFSQAEALFGLVNDSREITYQQTLTLQDLTLFAAQLITQEDPTGKLTDDAKEKVKEKILEKITEGVVNAIDKLDEATAGKVAGGIVSGITTLTGVVNLDNAIKLKALFVEVLKGGRARKVEETELAILEFVNLLFNKAGIPKAFATYGAIGLAGNFSADINRRAKAGFYTNLVKAMNDDIKKEQAQLKKLKESKKK